ncbi:MAG: hypothetical protein LBR13_06275, partial [Dysgonamonadaceae bacterium]|nr:hypothetical protein [Dysgonamonadaceae bacterium]
MKHLLFSLFLLVFTSLTSAQNTANSLELKDILGGKYSSRGGEEMRPSSDPEYYTKLSRDGKAIL